ncbi:unnamed protein product [Ceratitis capitata]|uniref:(Mediterranean fruit fly) hypothetical protein n=1 Tax=Ceratitis capitata TaxID=7213 RepID=A0A811UKF9_CERCA|nr:unnamed protein product [Ceratitis capitata]
MAGHDITFKKAGKSKPMDQDERDPLEENDVEVEPSKEEWTKRVSHESKSFEDFAQMDDDVTNAGEQTDDDNVKNCVKTCMVGKDSEEETQIPKEIKTIPMILALNALETVHIRGGC